MWGPCGADSQGHPAGLIIAGGENGNVILYDAAKIMAGESDNAVVAESDRHTGAVRGLDVNPFQARHRPLLFSSLLFSRLSLLLTLRLLRLWFRPTSLRLAQMSRKFTSGI